MKHCKSQKLLLIGILLVLMVLSSCSTSKSQLSASLPSASEQFYVYDETDTLSDSAVEHIVYSNDSLYDQCGAQIVIAIVETTGTADIQDYAYELFNQWKIGSSSKNNGVLLLLSLDEEDYWILQGQGLEKTLPSGTLKLMLNQYLEPDFAEGNYEDGVLSIFDALIAHFEAAYSITVTDTPDTDVSESVTESEAIAIVPSSQEATGRNSFWVSLKSVLKTFLWIFILIPAILATIILIIVACNRKRWGNYLYTGSRPGPRANRNPYSSDRRQSWGPNDPNAPGGQNFSGQHFESGPRNDAGNPGSGSGQGFGSSFSRGFFSGFASGAGSENRRSSGNSRSSGPRNSGFSGFGSSSRSGGRSGGSSSGGGFFRGGSSGSSSHSSGFSGGSHSSGGFSRGGGGGSSRGGGAGRR